MAVIQISRIQVRRGQKNQGSGIPQLASGELGWAMDSQELYIGNGAVSEGAPAVGNTKVLTEHDNLFTLIDTYQYKDGENMQTGASINSPTRRTLQSKLDDRVSVASFGAVGDGTDQTVALQRAIDQLYLNETTKGTELSRVTLHVEPGVYRISNSLKVPPYATIVGAGSDKTIFEQTGDFPVFQTVNSTSEPGTYADDSTSTTLNQAQKITIKGLTLDSVATSSVMLLQSCKDSHFEDLKVKGYWETGDAIDTTIGGIELKSLSSVVTCQNNSFKNIEFVALDAGVISNFDIQNNIWEHCIFRDLGHGILLGEDSVLGSPGQATGPIRNKIHNCKFEDIDRHGIWIENGYENNSNNNRFNSVGNVGGTEANAQYSVIRSRQANNNSTNDMFSRTADLSYGQSFIETEPYVSEIQGPVNASLGGFHRLNLNQRNTYITLFRLPGDLTRNYRVDYNYKSSQVDATRTGTLEIVLNKTTDEISVIDDFTYLGNNSYETNLDFEVELLDIDTNSVYDTLAVKVKNITASDDATLSFNINIQSD